MTQFVNNYATINSFKIKYKKLTIKKHKITRSNT